jgi:diacylglycerol kinase
MSKYKNSSIFKSLTYAYRGVAIALKSQRNFRFDVIFGAFTLVCAVVLKFSYIELALLVITINSVLFAELLNTVVEFVIDGYYGNRYSIIAKMSKDIAAGSVLITAISASIIGILLFAPKLIKLFKLF